MQHKIYNIIIIKNTKTLTSVKNSESVNSQSVKNSTMHTNDDVNGMILNL